VNYRLCGESSAVLYYNNIACLYLAMGKPNLACFYLKKALHENKLAVESVQVKDTGNLYIHTAIINIKILLFCLSVL